MERVQFHQEQMLAELKDLVQRGIFTQKEIKQIIKKRTTFESALVRRIAKKGDYLRYAAYEMGLEALRRKRVERLNLPPSPPSISDYALIRRQFYIFERAVRKFKSDTALWIEYIQVAKREKARALVGRISASALQLHPASAPLYILAAGHELDQHSPAAARALLQRGLRLNPKNVQLWTEYVKMELGYIESLRRRWEVLGIDLKDPESQAPSDPQDEVSLIAKEGDALESVAVMQNVMRGAVVETVMRNAVKSCPHVELFASLRNLLTAYPTPLRLSLLDELYTLLHSTLPNNPSAISLHAIRFLVSEDQDDLVDRLQEANIQFSNACKSSNVDKNEAGCMYTAWVEEWVDKLEDPNLRLYILHAINALIASLPVYRLSPSLLSGNLRLLVSPRHPSPPSPTAILKTAKAYSKHLPSSAELWLARLELARVHGDASTQSELWMKARDAARGADELLTQVWVWGIQYAEGEKSGKFEEILKSSMQHPSSRLHPNLLIQYLSYLYSSEGPSSPQRSTSLLQVFSSCLPTQDCYSKVFELESESEDISSSVKILETVYERWRGAGRGQHVEAALAFAEWLMWEMGNGKKAKDVIDRARTSVMTGEQLRADLERRWMQILNRELAGGLDPKQGDDDQAEDFVLSR